MVYERMSLRDLLEQVFSWLLVPVFVFTLLSINAVYNVAVYDRYLSNSSGNIQSTLVISKSKGPSETL